MTEGRGKLTSEQHRLLSNIKAYGRLYVPTGGDLGLLKLGLLTRKGEDVDITPAGKEAINGR